MNSNDMYDAILAIKNTSGMNAKMNMLRKHPGLKNVLKTTYSPYIHFNVKVPDSWVGVIGHQNTFFSEKTAKLLARLANGSLSGNSAKAAIKLHMGELSSKSAKVLQMIINKSFDFGLANKSINKVFPELIPVHAVQRAKAYESKRCQFPCLTSPKLDGLRGTFKNGTFYSRNGHKFLGLSKLCQEMQVTLGISPAQDWEVDGELMVRGEHFNEISGQIRAFTEADNAQFFAYDIVNSPLPLDERLALLARRLPTSMGKEEEGSLFYLEHIWCSDEDDVLALHNMFLDMGHEGSVVKQASSMYNDARTWDWMKIKETHTEDLEVIDVFAGQGKYAGMLGGLIVDFRGVAVRVGSGLSDKQRMYWVQDPDEIIGKTVEVAYHEITPAGSLRHPRLKTVRGDK